ncbi:MAG: phosphatase PAP2 family protein [Pseudobutyrivibrio sp.]|nr:phosphatase PAP2 family protein [Pseudobutyrivibrio sp.]
MENVGNIFYFDWEVDLLNFFQDMRSPVLDFFMSNVTKLGNGGIFWIILTLILIAVPKKRKIGWQALISIVFSFIFCNLILKPEIMRARPCWIMPEVSLLVHSPSDFSFPSGHSNASFAVATAILSRDKKIGIPALVLAAIIAISRLYLFVHWPTDVIAGICTGSVGGAVSYFLIDFIYKKIAEKGRKTL